MLRIPPNFPIDNWQPSDFISASMMNVITSNEQEQEDIEFQVNFCLF